jgi:hypothetical protein
MAGVGTLAPNVRIVAIPEGKALALPTYSKEGLVRTEYLLTRMQYTVCVGTEVFLQSGIDATQFNKVLENLVDKARCPSDALYRLAKTFEMLEEGRLINAE